MRKVDIETDAELLEKIQAAVTQGISPRDVENQRISIIYAGMPKDSAMTKQQIKEVIG